MQGAQRRNRSGDRVSRFVFTLNNWTQEEYKYLTEEFAPTVKCIIIGKEVGANGTPHLQGACILGTRMAFSKLKTLIGFKRAHIEWMHGNWTSNTAYCSKEDSQPFECGIPPSPGKRNDLAVVVERIQVGKESVRDLAQDAEGGVAVVKFHKGLTILRSLNVKPRTEPPKVFWLHGPTGTGKTHCAFECGRAFCRSMQRPIDDIWISSGGVRWFDGYDGQVVAIFDDLRSKQVNAANGFAFLLRLVDRYPMRVEFKGGFVEWTPLCILITCPNDIESEFRERNTNRPEDIEQLRRRVTRVYTFSTRFEGLSGNLGEGDSNLASFLQDTGIGGLDAEQMDAGGEEESDLSLDSYLRATSVRGASGSDNEIPGTPGGAWDSDLDPNGSFSEPGGDLSVESLLVTDPGLGRAGSFSEPGML